MDKVIEQFIKKEDAIEAKLKAHMQERFQILDLDTIMQHPEAELGMFADKLAEECFQKFSTECILEGIRFADSVKKKKTDVNIAVPKEENP